MNQFDAPRPKGRGLPLDFARDTEPVEVLIVKILSGARYPRPKGRGFAPSKYKNHRQKGVILLSVFIIMATLCAICLVFLYMSSMQSKAQSYSFDRAQAFWLAEAGIQRAIWKLKTPLGAAVGAEGENWTTAGAPVTETLNLAGGLTGSYTMEVERYDFARMEGVLATAFTESGLNIATNAIDQDNFNFWQPLQTPDPLSGITAYITIEFPYPLSVNKARFVSDDTDNAPSNYSWQVSPDGNIYTEVFSNNNNSVIDKTDEFNLIQNNITHLRLIVNAVIGGPAASLRIVSLQVLGAEITSTGTIGAGTEGEINRTITQAAVVDDSLSSAATQNDWREIVPANQP